MLGLSINLFHFLGFFCASLIILIILFKANIHSFLDPLLYLIITCASIMAALLTSFLKNDESSYFFNFVLPFIFFLLFLKFFISKKFILKSASPSSFNSMRRDSIFWNSSSIIISLFIYLLSSLILLLITINFYSSGFNSIFDLRYFVEENFGAFTRLWQMIVLPLLMIQFIRSLIFSSRNINLAILILLIPIIIFNLIYSRAFILNFGFMIGATYFFYRDHVALPKIFKNLFFILIFGLFFSAMFAVVTLGMYQTDLVGAFILLGERLLLSGDGILMASSINEDFENYNFFDFFNFIFGQFFGTLDKNFGWQLWEAFYGMESMVARGPNFLIVFQMRLLDHFWFIWMFVIVILTCQLRNLTPKYSSEDIPKIFLISNFYIFIKDAEYAITIVAFIALIWVMIKIFSNILTTGYSPIQPLEPLK